jgi:mxaJ protein
MLAAVLLSLHGTSMSQSWDLVVCAESGNLPFSNSRQEGFENRIAALVAEELDANLEYVWLDVPTALARSTLLQQGDCDLLMATVDGQSGYLSSVAYYRSSYVFVYRADSAYEVTSFDDSVLADLRIGVLMPDGRNVSPATQALANRGLIPNQVGFLADYRRPDSIGEIIAAVDEGTIDVAILWGPVAGYHAQRAETELVVRPVQPEIDAPFVPMVFSISVGLRTGDEDLKDLVNVALVRRWDEVQAILDEYGVPRLPLARPSLTVGQP